MNYQQALDYLYNQLPMYSMMGAKAFKADLKNTLALCSFLGNPQDKIKTIHIAGTNGKGSVSHILSAILTQSGYKTGLYTSPHLQDFRERIKIDGEMISQEYVIEFLDKIKTIADEIQPSFFELTFAMSIDYFASEKVEVAVIETGLGGRLDSTNIITPLLSIITNIGMDHMDILGDTKEKIAHEKAGIIKYSVPIIIGESIPETKIVFERKAQETQSPIYFAQDLYKVIKSDYHATSLDVTVLSEKDHKEECYHLDLNGLYQQKNLITVLSALDILNPIFHLKEDDILNALRQVKKLTGFHGRWEVIHQNPMVIIDVAHNEDGIRQVFQQITKTDFDQLHIVIGMVKDKDIQKVLVQLPKNAHYYFTQAQIPRALDAFELKEKANAHQLNGTAYPAV
ncbi:MAG: folylpolyglutamate synthase/dihydrofolate synthase family protein, partial [Ginsengibacter sp.]